MDDTLLAGQERDKARIEELVSQLNAASEAYYGGRDEIMSNFEWDSKFDELSVLEAKTGYVLPESPTQKRSSPGRYSPSRGAGPCPGPCAGSCRPAAGPRSRCPRSFLKGFCRN